VGVPTGGVTNPGGCGNGIYAVSFTGDLANCALSATITGAMPGEITATPAAVAEGTTAVTVRTFNSGGHGGGSTVPLQPQLLR